jgi:hypothetical protein
VEGEQARKVSSGYFCFWKERKVGESMSAGRGLQALTCDRQRPVKGVVFNSSRFIEEEGAMGVHGRGFPLAVTGDEGTLAEERRLVAAADIERCKIKLREDD